MNSKPERPCQFWLLRIAAVLCYLSAAYQFNRFSNTLFSFLFVELGFSDEVSTTVVSTMVVGLLLAAVATLIPHSNYVYLSLIGSGILMVEGLALTIYPPEWITFFALPCYALRIGTPIALLFFLRGRQDLGLTVAKVSCSLTFLGHGVGALYQKTIFLDYILAFFHDFGYSITLDNGIMLLTIIGTIDIAIAHHAAFFHCRRVQWVFRYMALWGLITASARVTFMGWGAWHEVTMRTPHFLVPLFVCLFLYSHKNISR